ncbi:MAG: SRPBCC family protein [Chloroflexi bacterium]|nr:SRPBCC family protein [Chloroflexota bacterium]
MVRAEHSVTIGRPVEDVFAFAATGYFANYARWAPGCMALQQVSPGPMAVGARGRELRKINGKQVEEAIEVTDYRPPGDFSFLSVCAGRRVRGSYHFEPADGGARVTFVLDFEAGLPANPSPAVVRSVQRQVTGELERLKDLVEAQIAGGVAGPV